MLLLRAFEERFSESGAGAGGGGAEEPGLGLEDAGGEIQDES